MPVLDFAEHRKGTLAALVEICCGIRPDTLLSSWGSLHLHLHQRLSKILLRGGDAARVAEIVRRLVGPARAAVQLHMDLVQPQDLDPLEANWHGA